MARRMVVVTNVFTVTSIPFEIVAGINRRRIRPVITLLSGKKVTSAIDMWPPTDLFGPRRTLKNSLSELSALVDADTHEGPTRECTVALRRPAAPEFFLWGFWTCYLAVAYAKVIAG